jgi:hypothetical protein
VVPIGEHDVTVRQNVLFIPTWPETVGVAVASGRSAYVKVHQRITDIGTGEGASATQQVFIEEVPSMWGKQILPRRARTTSSIDGAALPVHCGEIARSCEFR